MFKLMSCVSFELAFHSRWQPLTVFNEFRMCVLLNLNFVGRFIQILGVGWLNWHPHRYISTRFCSANVCYSLVNVLDSLTQHNIKERPYDRLIFRNYIEIETQKSRFQSSMGLHFPFMKWYVRVFITDMVKTFCTLLFVRAHTHWRKRIISN